MKMLVKYEFLKIFRKKSTWIIMIASMFVTAFFFGILPFMQFQTYNEDGVIKGAEGISYKKEQFSDFTLPLTDEYVTETIYEYQQLFDNPDNIGSDGNEKYLIGDAYWEFEAYRSNLLALISSNYDYPGVVSGYNNSLPKMDISSGSKFYMLRDEKVEALLNSSSNKMSEKQKEYWLNIDSKVETPFRYGYYEGWSTIISCFELFMFPILAICIVIAPVFSSEYQTGTDSVILSSKFGKTKLAWAKIFASLLFGVLAFTIHAVIAYIIALTAFGIDGANLPIQITNTVIPYPFTFSQATFINTGIIYLVLLAMIGLTLLLSSKMKSPYLVLIVIVPVLFIPMFLSTNGTTGAYNLTLLLLPYQATTPKYGQYISYQIGNIVFDIFTMRAIIYGLVTIILLPFAKQGFRKHQVS